MSVIVKGMEMPECCDVCRFSDWSNLNQTASCKLKEYEPCFANFSVEYRSKRADFCPLVALPDHHGRLVDADEMLKRLQAWNTSDRMDKALYNFALVRIMEQPTIVESEGEA